MQFSDYVIYVDESGDHGLQSIDSDYPIFVLAFCIFKKSDYVTKVVPELQAFKFRWFGHDLIVLHENEIVKRKSPFGFLQYDDKRSRFMGELNEIIVNAPVTTIAAVIRKDALKRRYLSPENPYQLALLFCLERAQEFIDSQPGSAGITHLICEARSPKEKPGMGREDRELELEFRRILDGTHPLSSAARPVSNFEIVFASKQANSTGLQLADLFARPVGLHVLRPDQENRAYDIIKKKIWRGLDGLPYTQGLKVFP